jgi:hypothetical protein
MSARPKRSIITIEDDLLALEDAASLPVCVQECLYARRLEIQADAIGFAVKGIEQACRRIRVVIGTEPPEEAHRPCACHEEARDD